MRPTGYLELGWRRFGSHRWVIPLLMLFYGVLAIVLGPHVRAETQEKILRVSGVSSLQERERTYFLHLPARFSKSSGKPYSLVLAFHGGGSSAEMAESYTGLSRKADEADFMVVYPEGIHHFWNDGRVVSGRDSFRVWRQFRAPDDVHFISKLLDQLSSEYPIDLQGIYATGISNGAVFVHFLAIRLGDRLAAIAPVAGNFPSEQVRMSLSGGDKKSSVSVIAFNGTEDPVMPFKGGQVEGLLGQKVESCESTARFWVQRNHLNPTLQWSKAYAFPDINHRDGTTAVRIEAVDSGNHPLDPAYCLIKIQGGGHSWPGVDKQDLRGRIYERKFGQTCLDIKANDLMWEFFQVHRKAN